MIEFYAPDILTEPVLPEGESAHCCRVLRMRKGDMLRVVDGKGNTYDCIIADAKPKATVVEILNQSAEALHWTPYITLAVAPTKNNDRMEWLAEKAVEIGVNELVFVECARNVRKSVKRERFEKILVSAMKQSLKATLPRLHDNVPLGMFLASSRAGSRYMGYCGPEAQRMDFSRAYDGDSDVSILIGPEGDFTPEEVQTAIKAGYNPVTFGNTRLRTETAALYALCAAHTIITQQQ